MFSKIEHASGTASFCEENYTIASWYVVDYMAVTIMYPFGNKIRNCTWSSYHLDISEMIVFSKIIGATNFQSFHKPNK